ncbi:hypothetical protein HZH68_015310 [Vespula germanica]|uniref:Uncharacterized protein n=1 Tax=Vespula germanica TaxID=30212 RepID=A0A834J762_VESGE|nr:hypothetical protein HZH68_015310 [Vespula germanica]
MGAGRNGSGNTGGIRRFTSEAKRRWRRMVSSRSDRTILETFDEKGRKVTRSEEYEEGEMRRDEERLEEGGGGSAGQRSTGYQAAQVESGIWLLRIYAV